MSKEARDKGSEQSENINTGIGIGNLHDTNNVCVLRQRCIIRLIIVRKNH